ncbi:MAG: D-lyxose/D-mannose family sugar isomerase [Kiritimatiellia bacterium]|jgi:D-lyxose ketol-isomerase
MRRSEINQIIQESLDFLRSRHFPLPPFAFWTPGQWLQAGPECSAIVAESLGWDITDFGSGDFRKTGLFLFTLRNGTLDTTLAKDNGKVYAEKIMIVDEGQVTPTHYHAFKSEDIINRGGGVLCVRLWNASDCGKLAGTEVEVYVDSILHRLPAGSTIRLEPGSSVCLTPRLYHTFWGEEGKGRLLVGEVSRVNDDATDNYFLDPVGRFPAVEEDVAPLHLLCSDYAKFTRFKA